MEARELHEIAPTLSISPEERDRIEKGRPGRGIAGDDRSARLGQRLRPHLARRISPMANTDVLSSTDVDDG
jgi:hypothetical protein